MALFKKSEAEALMKIGDSLNLNPFTSGDPDEDPLSCSFRNCKSCDQTVRKRSRLRSCKSCDAGVKKRSTLNSNDSSSNDIGKTNQEFTDFK